MSVAVNKVAIPEMLEITLEHEILHVQNRQKTPSWRCGEGAFWLAQRLQWPVADFPK